MSVTYPTDLDAAIALYQHLAAQFTAEDGAYREHYPDGIGFYLKGYGEWSPDLGGQPAVVLSIDDGAVDDAWNDMDGGWRMLRLNAEIQALDSNGGATDEATLEGVDSTLARDLATEMRTNYQAYQDLGLLDIRCRSQRQTAGENQQGLAALVYRRPHQITFHYEQG